MTDYSPQKDSALSYEEAIRACRELAAQGKLKKLFGQPIPPLTKPDDIERFGG